MTICGTIGRCLFGRIHHSRIAHNTPRLHLEILHKHYNTQEKVKINLYANFFFFLSFYFFGGEGGGGKQGVSSGNQKKDEWKWSQTPKVYCQ